MSNVNLKTLTSFFDKIKVKVADFLFRWEVEDLNLQMLLLKLLMKGVEVTVAFEDRPGFFTVL